MDPPNISLFNRSKLEQILSTSLRRKNENKKREREEWERFWHSNKLRVDISNEGGEDFFYTWEPRVTPLGCSPSVI